MVKKPTIGAAPRTYRNRQLANKKIQSRIEGVMTWGPIVVILAIGLYVFVRVKMNESSKRKDAI